MAVVQHWADGEARPRRGLGRSPGRAADDETRIELRREMQRAEEEWERDRSRLQGQIEELRASAAQASQATEKGNEKRAALTAKASSLPDGGKRLEEAVKTGEVELRAEKETGHAAEAKRRAAEGQTLQLRMVQRDAEQVAGKSAKAEPKSPTAAPKSPTAEPKSPAAESPTAEPKSAAAEHATQPDAPNSGAGSSSEAARTATEVAVPRRGSQWATVAATVHKKAQKKSLFGRLVAQLRGAKSAAAEHATQSDAPEAPGVGSSSEERKAAKK